MTDGTPIYTFAIDGEVLFKRYFDGTALFSELRDYYDGEAYRFAVPVAEWDAMTALLREHGFEPTTVEEFDAFCVVKAEYTSHTEILRDAVVHWSRRGHNFFLMKDPTAVEAAVERGATPVAETDLVVGL